MIRLEPEDLQDAQNVAHLARSAGIEPERFIEEFGALFAAPAGQPA
jgi:hypothetical protein